MRIPVRSGVVGLAAVAVLALAACGGAPAPQPGAAPPAVSSAAPVPSSAVSSAPRTLVTGLEVPWAVAFLPDGSALVTERESARLLRVTADGTVTPIGTVAGVVAQGEGGLMGVAVSPGFADDRTIVVAYTSATDNRVVRLRVTDDGTVDGSAQQVVVSGIVKAGIHNGGAVAFAPDGTLYAAEFGQDRFDEVNRITSGGNYGWPEVEGVGERAGFTDPLVTWSTDEASPSGLAYAGGALYAAGLRGERLWRVPVTGPGAVGTPEALLTGEFGRLRAVAPAPDGAALWVTTSNRDGRGEPGPDDDRIVVVPL